MTDYNGLYVSPPAPFAYITLTNTLTGNRLDNIPMLLDTGADISILPQSAVSSIGIVIDTTTTYELVGVDGRVTALPVVQAQIHFCGRTFRGKYLITDQDWGILGRNILNTLRIVLDGPRLRWHE